jgi:MinD-like ATPase involved in chromosome partitioning or flagellar assembly
VTETGSPPPMPWWAGSPAATRPADPPEEDLFTPRARRASPPVSEPVEPLRPPAPRYAPSATGRARTTPPGTGPPASGPVATRPAGTGQAGAGPPPTGRAGTGPAGTRAAGAEPAGTQVRPAAEPGPVGSPGPTPGPPGAQLGPSGGAGALGLGRGSHQRELVRRVGAPLAGTRRVVVLSIKGGVGKTTTVAVVGSMLAGLRRDKVVALDASSDWGTLAARLSVVPRQSVRDLAARGRHAVSERGVLAQLAASPSGLLVVGSDPQSLVSGALTEEEYLQTLRLLEYVGNLIVTDAGAGLQQSFLSAALHNCDQLVVASAATWDAVQSAAVALDWLAARGLAKLVERSIVVMNNLSPVRRRRHGYVRELKTDLARRARAVHEVPFDPALQPGGRILLRKLSAPTRQAYLEVAADVVGGLGGFATPR